VWLFVNKDYSEILQLKDVNAAQQTVHPVMAKERAWFADIATISIVMLTLVVLPVVIL
jgi:hypothetical protein